MAILETKDLKKEYKSAAAVTQVIKGVSLTVEAGEFVAITGASGSGKSTLLYLLSGLEKPTSGKVLFDGRDMSAFSERETARLRRREISFVYQYYNLIPNLNVYDNIVLPVRMDRRLTKADASRLNELAAVAGLQKILKKRPEQISGGEQQRTALLRAVFNSPKIIFADEPTGNLDSKAGEAVMALIKDINKSYGTTVIMVTHSAQHAEQAERSIHLSDGIIQKK